VPYQEAAIIIFFFLIRYRILKSEDGVVMGDFLGSKSRTYGCQCMKQITRSAATSLESSVAIVCHGDVRNRGKELFRNRNQINLITVIVIERHGPAAAII
jgi:hypothetical protein